MFRTLSLDKELEDIIQSLLTRISLKEQKLHSKVVEGKEFVVVDASSPNGIYFYDKRKDVWIKVEVNELKFDEDGIYVIYFDNTKCPACRKYDSTWFRFVREAKNDPETKFIIVLCDWFARECRAEEAAKAFERFKVKASPTTMLLYVKNGEIKHQEYIEGAVSYSTLSTRYVLFKHSVRIIISN